MGEHCRNCGNKTEPYHVSARLCRSCNSMEWEATVTCEFLGWHISVDEDAELTRLRDEVERLRAFRDVVVEAYLYSDRSDELLIKLDSAIKEHRPFTDSEEE